jgi:hypothetical protein
MSFLVGEELSKKTCIFCKRDSSESKGREHILPESIGCPEELYLRPHIVCDECNNATLAALDSDLQECFGLIRPYFISDDQLDVCDLVSPLPVPDAREKANILKRVIRKKNLIQYEKRNIYRSEAEEIVKSATRFYQWVEGHVL